MSKTSLKSHHSTNDFPNVGNKLQYSILTIVLCTTAYHAKIFIFSEQSTSKDQEQTNFNQKMNGASSRPNGLPNTKYQVNFYIVLETTILRFVYRGYEDLEFMIKIFVSGLLS